MSKTSYPNNIDTDLEIPRIDDNISEIGGDAINSLRDAIFAVEKTIGVDPQGNKPDLVTRINSVIDADGNIKTSALEARGLITLPISNDQIADDAAIEESKLDLDYSTIFLKGKIDSAATDLTSFLGSFSSFSTQTFGHFSGANDRHDGYAIDLLNTVMDKSDVESALHAIDDALTTHTDSTNAHEAFNISVHNEFANFSATTVQEALFQVDNLESVVIENHQDILHDNAIAIRPRAHQGDQGDLSETVLASTIYQTNISLATNILQVMRPNITRVTSKNINLRALEVGVAQNLRIAAGGVNRTFLDINLTSIIPTDNIDNIVVKINQISHSVANHYPISAYNTGGKLTIAHNLSGENFTIQILDTVSFSAATVLGFGDITSDIFLWSGNQHSVYVAGQRNIDLKSLVKISYVHSAGALDTISPGLGNLAYLGISPNNEGRVLCHITNHSTTSTDNGTHYILSFPTNASFILSSDIQYGTFDLEILADSLNFQNSASGEIFDVFAVNTDDGYCEVIKANRVSYGPLSGVSIRAVSEDFPNNSMSWSVIDASAIQLLEGVSGGEIIDIPTGFIGQLKVFAPDNTNSALFEVHGNPVTGQEDMIVADFDGSDDHLYLSTIHYAGNFGIATLKFVTDQRVFGGSPDTKTENKIVQTALEESIKDLRNNGVVRGFDLLSNDSSSLNIRGGRAYVDGRALDVITKNVPVVDFSASTKLLLLDRYGNFIIKDESAGYVFSDLTNGDSYGDNLGVTPILEFGTNGSTFDGSFTDRRLIIGKLDKRIINKIDDLKLRVENIENSFDGSLWGFTLLVNNPGARIDIASNTNFTALDATGFSSGDSLITTRRFSFTNPLASATDIFKAPGLTHANIFLQLQYTDATSGAFSTTGTLMVNIGAIATLGNDSPNTSEDYALVKTITSGVLPTDSVIEKYVASIPISALGLGNNLMFDITPTIKITGSVFADNTARINFSNLRIVTSSYSIAANILGVDSTEVSLAAVLGDVL